MKKQLCTLTVLCTLAFTAKAQNADVDQAKFVIQSNANGRGFHYPSTQLKNPMGSVSSSCNAATMCPQITTNTGSVRGYYFVAPVSFVLCGLLVPTDASTGPQSIEVLQFHGMTPPAYPTLTNSFTSLFYVASDTGLTTPVSCNILINLGDTIGIYGCRSTSTICSYAMPQCKTTILGDTATLYRSGMQFPLYNQQMHDVWSEIGSDISRVVMYVDAAPASVKETPGTTFKITPNPSTGIVSFEVKGSGLSGSGDKIEIYDVMGSKVYESSGSIPANLNLSDQPDGIYFVTLRSGTTSVTKKIVINR